MSPRATRESFGELREHEDVKADIDAFRQYFDKPVDHSLEFTLEIENLPMQLVQAMQFEAGLYAPPIEWNDAMPMMNWLSSAEQIHWKLRDPDTGKENMDIGWSFEVGDVIKIRIYNNPETIHPMHHSVPPARPALPRARARRCPERESCLERYRYRSRRHDDGHPRRHHETPANGWHTATSPSISTRG